LQELHKKCLGELTDDEREALDGMIEKMHRGCLIVPTLLDPP
jgi:hypothetical protein